jgi:hypothetical protein
MTNKETQEIKKLLTMMGFERNLNSDGEVSHYMFYKNNENARAMLFTAYYDEGLNDFVMNMQGDNMVPIRAQNEMILEVLLTQFPHKKDIIREWKINKVLKEKSI